MKISQGPTDRLVHCCDCGACSEQIDPLKHEQYCDGIKKKQGGWKTCDIYHFEAPLGQPEPVTEDTHCCRECGQAGTMRELFRAEGAYILVCRCGNCEALEISEDGVSASTWYRPIAGMFSRDY